MCLNGGDDNCDSTLFRVGQWEQDFKQEIIGKRAGQTLGQWDLLGNFLRDAMKVPLGKHWEKHGNLHSQQG